MRSRGARACLYLFCWLVAALLVLAGANVLAAQLEAPPADQPMTEAPPADAPPVDAPMAEREPQAASLKSASPESAPAENAQRDEMRRLKFSFRFQPWADVLEWFAEQADLSLVLDAPPPGTFNYTDSREYTVPEAIDLINGVLLTKGYTLVRRERMLMVLNLADGLPTDLVPRIQIEDLDRHGRFELVSVVFPLQGRDATEVETEIKPLLGPHGKTAVLPRTRQLVVTDLGGKMRSIAAVIESIPLPERDKPPRPEKPSEAALSAYSLETLDGPAALEVIKVLVPDAKAVINPKTGQLVASGTEAELTKIDGVLAQLRAGAEPDDLPRLESYPVKQAFRSELTQILTPVAPGATFQVDSRTGNLLVFGNGKQQAAVERTLLQLGRQGDDSARRIEIYKLEQASPSDVIAVLSRLLPEAQVAIDSTAKSIVALGDDAEQQAIAAAIKRLDTQALDVDRRSIEFYPLTGSEPSRFTTILTSLLPQSQITLDAPRKQLVAVAVPEDHQRLKQILAQLAAAPDEALELKIYPLKLASTSTLTTLLAKQAPDAQVTFDTTAQRLVALANAADHQQIAETLAALEQELAPPEATLVVYPLKPSNSKQVQAVLAALAAELPGLRTVPDAETGALSIWATAEQHEKVRELMQQVIRELPESERPQIVIYPIPDADPVALASMLQSLAPAARFSGDRQNATLAVWGTPDEQKLVQPAIDAMLKKYPPGREPKLEVYRVAKSELANLLVLLRGVAPQAQITGDAKHGNLVAWGTAEEHAKIAATLEGLASSDPADALTAEVYSAPETDASTLLQVLQVAVPEARLVANSKAGTVIGWGAPDDHAALREAVLRLQQPSSAEGKRTARVYRFRTGDANAAATVLRTLVPYAQLAVDTRTGSLAATALPSEHELIESAVAELEGEAEAGDRFELKVYGLDDQDPSSTLSVVRDLFAQRPEVRISLDPKNGKLVAWAPPAQQATIRAVVDGMKGKEGIDDRQLETYALHNVDSVAITTVLTTMFGDRHDVRFVADRTGRTLTVMAPPDVQQTVRATVEQMRGQADEIDVIPLRVVDAFAAASSIRQLFGDPSDSRRSNAPHVDADTDAQQIVVRGSKQQLAQIRQLLTKMGEPMVAADVASGPGRKMRVIPLGGRAAKSALEEIERVWPQLRGNPIRVVTPSAVVPAMKGRVPESDAPPPNAAPAADPPAPSPAPAVDDASGGAHPVPSPRYTGERARVRGLTANQRSIAASDRRPTAHYPSSGLTAAFSPEYRGEGKRAPHQSSAWLHALSEQFRESNLPITELAWADTPSVEEPEQPADEAEQPADDPADAENDDAGEPSPIVISVSDDSITIASEDIEALNQFEELFKVIVQRYATGGREFTVFTLKRANAMLVAQTLEQLFQGGSFGIRASNVTVVPDQRLNALVVQANRNDLATLEQLIEVLDTADAPENLAARKPRVIPLTHASAVEVAEVIRDTYKTQLSASSARRQVPTPRGLSRELSAVIDELNAAAAGPEMTLSVDMATNSLVILAATPLFDEVKDLVESLDTSAGNGTRAVKVIGLEKTNSKTMQQALKSLFEQRSRGRYRSRE